MFAKVQLVLRFGNHINHSYIPPQTHIHTQIYIYIYYFAIVEGKLRGSQLCLISPTIKSIKIIREHIYIYIGEKGI